MLLIACANIANLLLAQGSGPGDGDGRPAFAWRQPPPSAGAAPDRIVRARRARRHRRACRRRGGRWHSSRRCCRRKSPNRCSSSCRDVVVFAARLSLATGLLFGLFPAWHSTKPDLVSAIKAQAGQPSGARAAARFRTSLVTAQIALSMALLMCAGLFVKSLMNVSRVDLGLKIDNVVTFGISPELNGYDRARRKPSSNGRSRNWRAFPASPAWRPRWCRCWPATTGATTCRSRGSSGIRTPMSTSRLQRDQSGLFPHAGRAADGGA